MFHKKTKKNINIGVIGLGNIGSYFCNEILKKKRDISKISINGLNKSRQENVLKKILYNSLNY